MNTLSSQSTTPIAVSIDKDSQNVTVKLIDNDKEFSELHEEWNKLAIAQSHHSIFFRHEWFDAAWQWRQLDSHLHILSIYRNKELIGIFPGCIRSEIRSGISVQVLGFLDVPDTQFCNIIAEKADLPCCISSLSMWFRNNHSSWDILELNHIEEFSATTTLLKAALYQKSISYRTVEIGRNLSINISGNWEEYYKGRSRRLKKGNNLVANKLKRAGEVNITWLRDANSASEVVSTVIRISSKSWKTETGKTFDNHGPANFIRRLSEHAINNNWLSVWILSLDDKPIATEYQLLADGNVYALRADFDDNFSELSPGTLLNWRLLEKLFDQKMNQYYMGPGENAYKHRWTDQGNLQVMFIAYGHSFKGKTLQILEQSMRPIIKRLRQHFLSIRKRKSH